MTALNNPTKLNGGPGDDSLTGTIADEDIYGGDGNDKLVSAGGKDHLYGGNGNDTLDAGQRYDTAAAKWVVNTDPTYFDGGAGNDRITGSQGGDTILGGDGDDTIYSNGGNDHIEGGNGNDYIDASQRYDFAVSRWVRNVDGTYIDGGTGNNVIYGSAGNDTYVVRGRFDKIEDRGGNDTYLIYSRFDTITDFNGNNTAIVHVDWFKPDLKLPNWSWSWADGVEKLPYWIDALTNASAPHVSDQISSTGHIVKYAFAQAPASFFIADDKNGFMPFNAEQIAYTRKMMDYIGSLIDVQFVETTDVESPYTIIFGNNTQKDSAGYGSQIGTYAGGVVMLNITDVTLHPSADGGSEFYRVAVHEVGHALGLKHPFADPDPIGRIGAGPYLPTAEATFEHSVMSYTGSAGNPLGAYAPLDIAALQYLYGPSAALNSGDTTYKLDAFSSLMIADGGGIDTIDGSAITRPITMYLDPGYWSYVGTKANLISAPGQFTVDFGSVIENANGGAGDDHIIGNGAANRISGGSGNDVLEGGDGDDRLVGGTGNDTLNGGNGLDTAAYAVAQAGFTITDATDGWIITDKSGSLGVDKLAGVERLEFADGAIALDIEGTAAMAYRLYAAAFNRLPDAAGLGYWLAQMDNGKSLLDVATAFTGNTEFTAMFGASRTPESFLDTLYHNILHRAPDQGGVAFWAGVMHGGVTEGDILAQFSESAENKAQVVGQIAHGISYTPFHA